MNVGSPSTDQEPTAQRALRCFEELALETGLDDVSMRDVAKRLGISLASLQYHYPTKAALVDAVVAAVIELHQRRIDEALHAANGADRLTEVVHYIVAANLEDAAGGLMSMIWARAAHDEAAATTVHRFMQAYLERLTAVVAEAAPHLSPPQARMTATMAIALLEGLEEVRGPAVEAGAASTEITATAVEIATRLPAILAERTED
jgi:AcrR family transcriptional regulator